MKTIQMRALRAATAKPKGGGGQPKLIALAKPMESTGNLSIAGAASGHRGCCARPPANAKGTK
jgi:hypothetical protein